MRDPYTDKKLPLPNTAEQVARVNLSYSKDAFSGKLTYQWRGRSLKASISESGLSVWNEGAGSLNLNFAWRLNELLQFNLDARNLLGEDQVRTTDDDSQIWRITERDRSLSATLRAKW
jgi:outer membrane receptor protein involved in Fe transport